jgi:hypothetical protein
MYTKQISIFLENKKGRLAEVTGLLRDQNINIRALALADMSDIGVLRLIVDERERCLRILKERGMAAQETDVIAAEIDDKPGGLHRIIAALERDGLNIEYMYTLFAKNSDKAIVVLKISDAARAVDTLGRSGISMLPEDTIQRL